MADICEHPFCTRSISSKCTNHCQLDLCPEHVIEHGNLFLAQYEKSLANFQKLINDYRHTIEQDRVQLDAKYDEDLRSINGVHCDKLKLVEHESTVVTATVNLIERKRQLLASVNSGQASLHQYDVEQVKLYQTKLHECLDGGEENKFLCGHFSDVKDVVMASPSISSSSSSSNGDEDNNSTDDDDDYDDNDGNHDDDDDYKTTAERGRDHSRVYRGTCPLTQFGAYGLAEKHNIRLCPSKKNQQHRCLVAHFRRYHRLAWSLAHKLTSAISDGLDPSTTCVFEAEVDPADEVVHPISCPLNQIRAFSQNFSCSQMLPKESLRKHLIDIHQLTSTTSHTILDSLEKNEDLTNIDLDEFELA